MPCVPVLGANRLQKGKGFFLTGHRLDVSQKAGTLFLQLDLRGACDGMVFLFHALIPLRAVPQPLGQLGVGAHIGRFIVVINDHTGWSTLRLFDLTGQAIIHRNLR